MSQDIFECVSWLDGSRFRLQKAKKMATEICRHKSEQIFKSILEHAVFQKAALDITIEYEMLFSGFQFQIRDQVFVTR